jgi:DNA-nicking Smr family endonuclease
MRRTTKEERELFQAALLAPIGLRKTPAPKPKRKTRAAAKSPAPPDEPAEPSGKRRTTREERALFEATLSGRASPKKTSAKTKSVPPPKPQPPRIPTGLDGNTARKLKRGELAPTAKLDLHGLTEAAAHRTLTAFVLAAHRRGDRLVLIVTGKGDPQRGPGVLKLMVPRWLDEAPMAKLIAEKRWAHLRHGGEGALYVYLRKQKP